MNAAAFAYGLREGPRAGDARLRPRKLISWF